jgi:hypothetical protein
MAYTIVFNPWTKKFDYVGATTVDTTPGGTASALLLEDGFGLLLEDGAYLLLEA